MFDKKSVEILQIIEANGRIESEKIAKMVDLTAKEVDTYITELEDKNVILSYSAVVDWAKLPVQETVTAMIDVKVAPKRGVGFDEVAERIHRFPEVRALYLMSGAYDLSVVVEGKTMQETARFVSERLSTIDSVLSTTTHFQLKTYKHDGVIFKEPDEDRRIVVTP
ncbi:Lrp/AsnC family transcriptional regulator [Shouchella sp. JSM 1781072]|uniref:Lrp/AsnC family transcriptional regulator n=1 Tax=Bacillaceae TaxID=186817 RepID=UPI000C078A55|nr:MULTISPECIES: Lrp/AsnC family transcriptional regulator [Bacillaceae]UTR05479.1 Lrp/AsnC family transcriptional regulator [Alkalihalobacillus sp. LMS6]